MVESDDEEKFDEKEGRIEDYENVENGGPETVCCDVGVMRKVLGLMNGGQISCEGLSGSIKSGVMKSGVMQHRLPNLEVGTVVRLYVWGWGLALGVVTSVSWCFELRRR